MNYYNEFDPNDAPGTSVFASQNKSRTNHGAIHLKNPELTRKAEYYDTKYNMLVKRILEG